MEELQSFCTDLIAQWSQQSIPYLDKCLDRLQKFVTKHPFNKRSEEIFFFKEVKPVVMGRLIYMCEVHNKEIFRPFDSAEEKDYLADEVDEIDAFFKQHESLYSYYKDGLETLDIRFFVRQVEDRFKFRDLPIEIDPVFFYGQKEFSTGFDYLFAKFHAYELLRDHLENELEALLVVGDEVPPEEIKFTGSEADFVQFVELLKEVGRPVNPETNEPATDEEIFELMKGLLKPDLRDDVDFNTLKLTSGNSDLPERMIESLDKLHKQREDEERDIDYNNEEKDKPKE
jgi:hypothetical protein